MCGAFVVPGTRPRPAAERWTRRCVRGNPPAGAAVRRSRCSGEASAACGDDADQALERVDRVAPAALDLRVGLGERLDRAPRPSSRPARQVAASAVDLPGREAERLTPAAGRRPVTPETFAIVRIFIANAATIGTGSAPDASAWRSRSSASPWRPAIAASATANGVGLDAPAVVPRDDLLGDLARRCRRSAAGRRPRARRGRRRTRRRARAARPGVMLRRGRRNSAAAKSCLSLSRFSSAQTISMPPPAPARIASSSFLPRTAAGVTQHERTCRRRALEVGERLVEERVGALLDAARPG